MAEVDDKIIYSLIAKNEKPLVEYSNFTGTFNQLCINYLKQISPNSSKAVKIDDFMLFYINENYISYIIMTGKSYPKEAAVGCLESIRKEFTHTFEGRDFDGELNFGLNEDFKEKLKLKFEYFNENKDVTDDKLGQLKDEMAAMKDEVLNASGLLDERGDKIKILDEKADVLSRDSSTYYRQSKRVRQAEFWKKIKLYIGIGVVGLIVLYFILAFFCGFNLKC